MGQILRINAHTVILKENFRIERILCYLNRQRSAAVHMLHAVFHNITEGFHRPLVVPFKHRIGIS